jgi:hypothetical protein
MTFCKTVFQIASSKLGTKAVTATYWWKVNAALSQHNSHVQVGPQLLPVLAVT